jgi:hypothetical protein
MTAGLLAKVRAVLAIIPLIVPASAEAAKEPLILKPAAAWHVDYAHDRCRLMRQFGAGEEQLFLIFDRYGPEQSFRLTLAGKPVKTALGSGDAVVQFGPAEAEQKFEFYEGNLGDMPALVFPRGERIAPLTSEEKIARDQKRGEAEVAPISEERQKAVRHVTIGRPLRRAVTLETGSLRAPFGALDTCIDELQTHWGIDVEKHKSLTRRAKPAADPQRWVVPADYPLKMLSAGQPAVIEFRLSVGADGKPTACHIQSTTRPKEFDDAVCKSVMRRAQFEPALDAEGNPIASYHRNRVLFQIP